MLRSVWIYNIKFRIIQQVDDITEKIKAFSYLTYVFQHGKQFRMTGHALMKIQDLFINPLCLDIGQMVVILFGYHTVSPFHSLYYMWYMNVI